MALKTVGAQLEEVQLAITAVMSGQSYDIAGRKMTKANLAELTSREDTLINRGDKYGFDKVFNTTTTKSAVYGVSFGNER